MCALIRRLGEEDDITGYCGHNNYMYDHFEITHEHNTTTVNWLHFNYMYGLFQG